MPSIRGICSEQAGYAFGNTATYSSRSRHAICRLLTPRKSQERHCLYNLLRKYEITCHAILHYHCCLKPYHTLYRSLLMLTTVILSCFALRYCFHAIVTPYYLSSLPFFTTLVLFITIHFSLLIIVLLIFFAFHFIHILWIRIYDISRHYYYTPCHVLLFTPLLHIWNGLYWLITPYFHLPLPKTRLFTFSSSPWRHAILPTFAIICHYGFPCLRHIVTLVFGSRCLRRHCCFAIFSTFIACQAKAFTTNIAFAVTPAGCCRHGTIMPWFTAIVVVACCWKPLLLANIMRHYQYIIFSCQIARSRAIITWRYTLYITPGAGIVEAHHRTSYTSSLAYTLMVSVIS